MDLLDNSFHLLDATPRDNRSHLMDLAEDKSLIDESDAVNTARAELTNPRKRLVSEVSWLPGMSPKQVNAAINILQNKPSALLELLENNTFPSLAAANLIASAMTRLDGNLTGTQLSEWIYSLAKYHININNEQVLITLNEERVISEFPEISDITLIEAELSNRRNVFRQSIKISLDKLPSNELIIAVTKAVEEATDIGEKHAPILIDDMVDTFEVEAQKFLEKETGNIITLIDSIRESVQQEDSEETINLHISQLEKVLKNWDVVAQPMQVSSKSRGLPHELSIEVGGHVRALALDLFNDHGHVEISKRLTIIQKEVFAEVDTILDISIEDEIALDNIVDEREEYIQKALENAKEWNEEITYKAELGLFFKDKLEISPDGIQYKNRTLPLDEIIGIRWGGTKRSVNGIPTGTEYSIVVGTSSQTIHIETKAINVYQNFIGCLWKAVGVRLLTELLDGLREGNHYQFGKSIVNDNGIELEKFKLFGANEKVFCPWSDLVILNGPGTFIIAKEDNRKISVELEYQSMDNIHVLEAAISSFWKKGGAKLSSLLSAD